MTLGELLIRTYEWLDTHAAAVLAVSLAVPLLGMIGARLGRGGRSDRDGRQIADLTLGFAFLLFAVAVLGLAVAQWGFERGPLEANLLLLIAPLASLSISLLGIRWIFPLSELGSARTARDVALFAAAVALVFWLFSTFRGWGVVFFGGLLQLLVLVVVIGLLLRYLYRRL